MAVLLPINYTDSYFVKEAAKDNIEDHYTSVFVRLTMSNIMPRSSMLW